MTTKEFDRDIIMASEATDFALTSLAELIKERGGEIDLTPVKRIRCANFLERGQMKEIQSEWIAKIRANQCGDVEVFLHDWIDEEDWRPLAYESDFLLYNLFEICDAIKALDKRMK